MTSKLFNFLIKLYCFSFLYMYNNRCKELETIYKLIFDNLNKKILAKSFISVILIIELVITLKKDNKKG